MSMISEEVFEKAEGIYQQVKQQGFNPNWQEKQLRILDRDNHSCKFCGGNYLLVVYRKDNVYKEGNRPWDYDDKHFATACGECYNEIVIPELRKRG